MKYYYKTKNGKNYLCLKSPLSSENLEKYVEITENEFNSHLSKLNNKTERNEKKREIASLKKQLADTDYCVIKIAEGVATTEEYAEILAQRQTWRARINELLEELA